MKSPDARTRKNSFMFRTFIWVAWRGRGDTWGLFRHSPRPTACAQSLRAGAVWGGAFPAGDSGIYHSFWALEPTLGSVGRDQHVLSKAVHGECRCESRSNEYVGVIATGADVEAERAHWVRSGGRSCSYRGCRAACTATTSRVLFNSTL